MRLYNDLLNSWIKKDNTINSLLDIKKWIDQKKVNTKVKINKINFNESNFWYLNKTTGIIENHNLSFFKIVGLELLSKSDVFQQPIIIQEEIGYLGIICKLIDNTLYFLMQAKIEPGNVNKVQISPTIQATKSNFTQKHGGHKPPYLDYFLNAQNHVIVTDQIQSEQSSRFFKKRNRNIILLVDEDIEVLSSHMWMTLGQIKELLKIDNLVNMDTRTVISSIPFHKANVHSEKFKDKTMYNSLFNDNVFDIVKLYHRINNHKMFNNSVLSFIPLPKLDQWNITDHEIFSDKHKEFKVIFCEIEIEGREVRKWSQPLFEAIGKYTFGLFTTIESDIMYFLVKLTPEIGSFDNLELGPTVQFHSNSKEQNHDSIHFLFFSKTDHEIDILYDVNLSEEGGRFFHEENRNIIIEINKEEITDLPDDYFWFDYKTLLHFMEFNNILNIQLRNLISLLEV